MTLRPGGWSLINRNVKQFASVSSAMGDPCSWLFTPDSDQIPKRFRRDSTTYSFIHSFIHYTIYGSHIKQSKSIKHRPHKEER